MSYVSQTAELLALWRQGDDHSSNPAGPLFIGGAHAEADIACETSTGSGKCGTACSGSYTRYCC